MMNKKGQLQDFGKTIILLGAALFLFFFSGILLAGLYYTMDQTEDVIRTINFSFELPNNYSVTNLTNFQDVAEIIYYPILGLRSALVYISYIFIFAMMIGFGILAFMGQRHPIYFVPYFIILLIFTGFSIPLSNAFETLLENPFFLSMMVEFVIFSKIMLYLPQFIFFTGLFFAAIASIGIIKPRNVQNQYEQIEF